MKHDDQTTLDGSDDDEDDVSIDGLNRFAYGLTSEDAVSFQRRKSSLLVSFETLRDPARALKSHRGFLTELAEDMEWSHLSFVSRGRTLFRAPELITFIDALADSTLFDQFDDVLFYGAGAGAHGALSYALTAPVSRVIAVAPLVGLDATHTPSDPRLDLAPKIDVTARYAPSPENLATAESVFLVLDATHAGDMDQARQVAGETVHPLICRDLGQPLEAALHELGIVEDLLSYGMEGVLTPELFYAALRVARRDNAAYLRRLTALLIERDRPLLEALAVRNVARRTGRKRFIRRFAQLEASLAEKGISVPPALDERRS